MVHSQVKSVEDSEMRPLTHLSFIHKKHVIKKSKERKPIRGNQFWIGHMKTIKENMKQIKTDDKVVRQQANNRISLFGSEVTKPC